MTQTAFSLVTTRHSAFSRFKVTHSASSLLNLEDICLYLDKYAQTDCGLVSDLNVHPVSILATSNVERAAHCSGPCLLVKYRCSQYLINILKQEGRYVLSLEYLVHPHNRPSVQDIVPVITFFAIYLLSVTGPDYRLNVHADTLLSYERL